MSARTRFFRGWLYAAALGGLVSLLQGCGTTPSQTGSLDYRARAETRTQENVRVTAVVLSPQETLNTFVLPLAENGIQPIWVEIDNQADNEFALMLLSIDPNYFAPSEIAWKFRGQRELSFDQMMDIFFERHVPVTVLPHGTVSGFVYANLDPGAKAFAIELFGEGESRLFEFAQLVPGFEADFMRVDFRDLYEQHGRQDLDIEGLREYLEQLPCCVLGGDRESSGDPLNLAIVGEGRHLLVTLVRRGWDLTETMRSDTAWRTVASSIFRSNYRTSPVSSLYVYGRSQDIALQKTRRPVNERNHLRLWLAPVTLHGESIWVGQISRDIGVRFTSKTFVTHKIDPFVDEARQYIALDVAASQSLRAFTYVKGVGYSDRDNPRFNYTKDPFYTDGQRLVLILGDQRLPLHNIEFLQWGEPAEREHADSPASN